MANKNAQDALNKNKKTILIAVAAAVVVIAGFFLYKAYVSGPREEKASTALAKGQEYFNNEMFDKALNGDGAGYAGFVKVADDFSGTDAANLANLYAGLCYANLNKWQEAVNSLEAYSASSDAMVSPAAQAALGNAYAHLNQLDKAVDALKKAAKMADAKAEDNTNNSLSPTFLLQAAEILEKVGEVDVVGIDEAQFFDDEIVNVCDALASRGVRVIVAGLDMDYQCKPFGAMPQLLSIADDVLKVHAICIRCGRNAYVSHRKVDVDGQVMLGEKMEYEPLCRECYRKEQARVKGYVSKLFE